MTCTHPTIGVEFWRDDGGYVVARCCNQDCLKRGLRFPNGDIYVKAAIMTLVAPRATYATDVDYYQDKRESGFDADGHADAWDSRWIYKMKPMGK